MKTLTILFFFLLLSKSHADCDCSVVDDSSYRNKHEALVLKITAIFSILIGGFIGVCIPILGKWVPAMRPDRDVFFVVKAFAAGVILATGFIHILPDAFKNLTSPCLSDKPWGEFPFTGFVAMVAAIGTLMVDSLATGYFNRRHFIVDDGQKGKGDVEDNVHVHEEHVHVHTHAGHGHAHGSVAAGGGSSELIRHRVISQAKFKARSMAIMILFFSLTTPVGIAIGIGISSVYNENSPTALIVEGILNAAAAGILIYMALVDLLAADFMNPKVQGKGILQAAVNMSLLVGAGLMSLLAKWA
ncbi:uncharacterized protein A4U43_C02F3190 [Asparagus officinalis]|uniref:Uncharacterized protein n=1 Tax=Asparagus officinalis TaxID=4686 RepID=A0A5P1FJJ8_ASPOF|nr:uncharacterized protein A4U43_C02F3190 [Asparagus officinalis]